MFGFVGIFFTLAMVFGGYLLAGGKMGVILHALPFEMMMIMAPRSAPTSCRMTGIR